MKPLGYAGWQHVPCYFMFGKNDNAYLPALAEMLVKQPGFMKEPVVNWVDGGHFMFVTHPKESAECIIRAAQS